MIEVPLQGLVDLRHQYQLKVDIIETSDIRGSKAGSFSRLIDLCITQL